MTVEHLDVLIIGAGLSGVGAAYRLQTECPGKSYAIIEGRANLGGTWDLFRYPGIRSDSDMFTLGYPFRPWTDAKAIADGPSILAYIRETAEDFGIDRHIRFHHHVTHASWSSETSTWTVDVERGDATEPIRITCSFLYLCSGYYSYEGGHMPEYPGIDAFAGEVIHPQAWPEDLDHRHKRIVVIGSGATAVTLVPALAAEAAQVTMLQRSPSYIASLPARDGLADALRRRLPEHLAHRIARWKNVLITTAFYQLCRRRPTLARRLLKLGVARLLPEGFDTDRHFTPTYEPWDQRLCLVPDGDLFKALSSGRAAIVTDRIDTFIEDGIRLQSGDELDADIVISATGLTVVACGGIQLEVDGEAVDVGRCLTYRGHMLSGVPNLALCVGYTNASWTLRADLSSRSVCRLLNHMDERGYSRAVPTLEGPSVEARPILDLTSGYVQRAAEILPKQGPKAPWHLGQNYILDALSTRFAKFGESLSFSSSTHPPAVEPAEPGEFDEMGSAEREPTALSRQ